MKIVDLYDRTTAPHDWTTAFEERGHEVRRVDAQHAPPSIGEFAEFTLDADVVCGSPPCNAFSLLGIRREDWDQERDYVPVSARSKNAVAHLRSFLSIVRQTQPSFWWIENPRCLTRKLPLMRELPRVTISQCQYGFPTMKPTDLFGELPIGYEARMCSNGAPCHVPAPRAAARVCKGMAKERRRACGRRYRTSSHSLCLSIEKEL